MALDGKTPAEEAGINLDLKDNRWKSLIEKSVKNDNHNTNTITEKENLENWF